MPLSLSLSSGLYAVLRLLTLLCRGVAGAARRAARLVIVTAILFLPCSCTQGLRVFKKWSRSYTPGRRHPPPPTASHCAASNAHTPSYTVTREKNLNISLYRRVQITNPTQPPPMPHFMHQSLACCGDLTVVSGHVQKATCLMQARCTRPPLSEIPLALLDET